MRGSVEAGAAVMRSAASARECDGAGENDYINPADVPATSTHRDLLWLWASFIAERPRSMARDLGLLIRTDFLTSPLHCVVRHAAITYRKFFGTLTRLFTLASLAAAVIERFHRDSHQRLHDTSQTPSRAAMDMRLATITTRCQ